MKLDHEESEHLVETVFRNGTLTVVGIFLSFSLGFLAKWGENPLPWRLYDIPSVLALCLGIALQFRSLWLLLGMGSLKKAVFERANRIFLTGAVITACGIVLAIAADLLETALH